MGRTIGKSSIEVMRKRFPDKASQIETYADAFDVLAEEVKKGGGGGGSVTVDSALSNSSENPVQNKVVKGAIDAADKVIRVPFTLTVDTQTGDMTATTDAIFADVIAALAANKVIVADVVTETEGVGASHYCGVMSGAVGENGIGDKLAVVVIDTVNSGANLGAYRIKWTAERIDVALWTITTT